MSSVLNCACLDHDDIAIVVLTEDLNFNLSTKVLKPCRLEADWSNLTAVNKSYITRAIGLGRVKSKTGEKDFFESLMEDITGDDGRHAENLMVSTYAIVFQMESEPKIIILREDNGYKSSEN